MLHRVWKGVVGDNHMYHSTSSDGLTWTDQRQIRGRTSHGPALIVFNGRLHRAWKADDTSSIRHSSSPDGVTWTDPQSIPDAYTSHGPALAAYNDTLYLAWKAAGHTSMYLNSLPAGGQWSRPRGIAGRTSHSPALSAGNDRLCCVWKGAGTDTRMFATSSAIEDGDPYLLVPVSGGGWELELSGRTSDGPALTFGLGCFFRLWKGEGTGTRMFIVITSVPEQARAGSPYHQQVGGQTSHGPALTYGLGRLYRLWKNSTDNTMLISIADPTSADLDILQDIEWTAEHSIPGLTSHTPSLVNFGR